MYKPELQVRINELQAAINQTTAQFNQVQTLLLKQAGAMEYLQSLLTIEEEKEKAEAQAIEEEKGEDLGDVSEQ